MPNAEVLLLARGGGCSVPTRAKAALKSHADRRRAPPGVGGWRVRPQLSDTGKLKKGLTIRSLREALEAATLRSRAHPFDSDISNPMVALNSAMAT